MTDLSILFGGSGPSNPNISLTREEARFCRRNSVLIFDVLWHIHHVATEAVEDKYESDNLPHKDSVL